MSNIILNTDSYKASHYLQYPPDTTHVYSYVESRGGEYDRTVFFGLQMFIQEYLSRPITKENIDEAEAVYAAHGLPFNREGWEHILYNHGGMLPLKIKAVPEGYVVPIHNVLMTVENTDPKCFWLTSFIETALLRAIWYPTTVATQSWDIKRVIKRYMDETSDHPEGVDFKLHDFGARGVSSFESAGIGGLAHLVNFKGTDTVTALLYGKKYYDAEMAGFSIPASEHSTMTSWGKDHEADAYRNMVQKFGKPGALVAVVSDSYDIFNATEKIWGEELKDEVVNSGAIVVVRPDSGDPILTPVKVVQLLAEKYGTTKNSKGFNVLNNVRVIQGDGIDINSISEILRLLKVCGFSADNIAFGMGGALLQKVNRDTQKFAMKCSAVQVNGEWRNVVKRPVGDKTKHSKGGRLALLAENGKWWTDGWEGNQWQDQMQVVYRDGSFERHITLEAVRENAARFMTM